MIVWRNIGVPGVLALCALVAGCSTPPPETPREVPRASEATEERVRVGAVLRLARAGVIEETKGADGSTAAVVLVPSARGSSTWQRAVDTQGNQFRVAPGGRIVPEGEPQPNREPASVANVAYYFAQSLALMVSRYRRQGLAMAAEILDLPSKDPVVAVAQRRLCVLFGRVGLSGNILDQLYQNLGAVPHRSGDQVEVRNHVHGFLVRVPLHWTLLAGPLPDLGPKATGLVFALPKGWGGKGDGQANLLWTTTKAPGEGDLPLWATRRRLATSTSREHPFQLAAPAGVTRMLAQRVEPLEYQGRVLRSWQVFIEDRGLLHHLALLAPMDTDVASVSPVLEALLSTFRATPLASPCESQGDPGGQDPRQSSRPRL